MKIDQKREVRDDVTVSSSTRDSPESRIHDGTISDQDMGNTQSNRAQSPATTPEVDLSRASTQPVEKNLKRPLETTPEPDLGNKRRLKKRTRYKEPPIWAQRAKHTFPLPQSSGEAAGNSVIRQEMRNGHVMPHSTRAPIPIRALVPQAMQIQPESKHFLGEPTFNTVVPHEDNTRLICYFLMAEVVDRDEFAPGLANGLLEIEAKLGTLVDRNTNMRIALPVRGEAVLADSVDVAFESTMTEVSYSMRVKMHCDFY